jgi:hypothetical protein
MQLASTGCCLLVPPSQLQLYLSLMAGYMHGVVIWTEVCHLQVWPAISAINPQVCQRSNPGGGGQVAGQRLLLFCLQSLCWHLHHQPPRQGAMRVYVTCACAASRGASLPACTVCTSSCASPLMYELCACIHLRACAPCDLPQQVAPGCVYAHVCALQAEATQCRPRPVPAVLFLVPWTWRVWLRVSSGHCVASGADQLQPTHAPWPGGCAPQCPLLSDALHPVHGRFPVGLPRHGWGILWQCC